MLPVSKENGYIIAAVVVGEDAAASKNLVYAHTDDVEMESYDKTADEWTWTRKGDFPTARRSRSRKSATR